MLESPSTSSGVADTASPSLAVVYLRRLPKWLAPMWREIAVRLNLVEVSSEGVKALLLSHPPTVDRTIVDPCAKTTEDEAHASNHAPIAHRMLCMQKTGEVCEWVCREYAQKPCVICAYSVVDVVDEETLTMITYAPSVIVSRLSAELTSDRLSTNEPNSLSKHNVTMDDEQSPPIFPADTAEKSTTVVATEMSPERMHSPPKPSMPPPLPSPSTEPSENRLSSGAPTRTPPLESSDSKATDISMPSLWHSVKSKCRTRLTGPGITVVVEGLLNPACLARMCLAQIGEWPVQRASGVQRRVRFTGMAQLLVDDVELFDIAIDTPKPSSEDDTEALLVYELRPSFLGDARQQQDSAAMTMDAQRRNVLEAERRRARQRRG